MIIFDIFDLIFDQIFNLINIYYGSGFGIKHICIYVVTTLILSSPTLSSGTDKKQPAILNFSPKYGPFAGGTKVIIQLNNYPNLPDSIVKINLSNGDQVQCISHVLYTNILKHTIMCIMDPYNASKQLKVMSGKIVLTYDDQFVVNSTESFTFVEQIIHKIVPDHGPISGRSKITIYGIHMDAGSEFSVSLGNLPCTPTSINRIWNTLECITSPTNNTGDVQVKIQFDKAVLYSRYSYVGDPRILAISSGGRGNFGAIVNGGIRIKVIGENLDVVQRPMFYVDVNGQQILGYCFSTSPVEMHCKSPRIHIDQLSFSIHMKYVELNFGFLMDEVKSVMNLSSRQYDPFSKLKIYDNPIYYPFDDSSNIFYDGEYLEIRGENLNYGCQESDIEIYVGREICNLTELTTNTIRCAWIPNLNYTFDVEVVVWIGGDPLFNIGRLYVDANTPYNVSENKPIRKLHYSAPITELTLSTSYEINSTVNFKSDNELNSSFYKNYLATANQYYPTFPNETNTDEADKLSYQSPLLITLILVVIFVIIIMILYILYKQKRKKFYKRAYNFKNSFILPNDIKQDLPCLNHQANDEHASLLKISSISQNYKVSEEMD